MAVPLHGAVLLEVILALAIFVTAAGVITGMLSTSIGAVERLRQEAAAADLMVTVESELGVGITELRDVGPTPFDGDNLSDWTWQVATESVTLSDVPAGADSPLKSVEIIIQNTVTGYTLRQTTLMGQWASGSSDDAASSLLTLPAAGGGP